MARSKHSGASWKNGYKAYKTGNRFVKNKVSKLTRHVLEDEDDDVAASALKRAESGALDWKRTKPRHPGTYAAFNAETKKTYHIVGKALVAPTPWSGRDLTNEIKNTHPTIRGKMVRDLLKHNPGIYFKVG